MPRDAVERGQILPAYDTKHLKTLHYDLVLPTVPKQDLKLELLQDDAAGSTTGTTLWLGGQVLAAYLLSLKRRAPKHDCVPKAIDLGSGIGYTSLVLAAVGYKVTATDLPILTEGILASTVTSNKKHLARLVTAGDIQSLPLDWTTGPQDWPPSIRNEAFDLIFSSDSIYQQALVQPLLRTIHELSRAANAVNKIYPDIYIAYEHRDDAQYTSFTQQAEVMSFKVRIVPKIKVSKAVSSLYGWNAEVYEGITVLHMKLQSDKSVVH